MLAIIEKKCREINIKNNQVIVTKLIEPEYKILPRRVTLLYPPVGKTFEIASKLSLGIAGKK